MKKIRNLPESQFLKLFFAFITASFLIAAVCMPDRNAMFSGFVADEEYPLAFIVVVENGGYGSHTCVPILSKVLGVCKAVMDQE